MKKPRIKVCVSRDGKPLTPRQAVTLGVERGWTAKETAFETNWSIGTIQTAAGRMKVSLAYTGIGRPPTYPNGFSTKTKGGR